MARDEKTPRRLTEEDAQTTSSVKGMIAAKCSDEKFSMTNLAAYASPKGTGKKTLSDPGPWIFAAPDGPQEKAMFKALCGN